MLILNSFNNLKEYSVRCLIGNSVLGFSLDASLSSCSFTLTGAYAYMCLYSDQVYL